MNRSAGKAARQFNSEPGASIRLPPGAVVHPLAAELARPGIRFRLPTFADLKNAYTGVTVTVPASVIKERVVQLLERLKYEKKLTTSDPVPIIIAKIFPGPGLIDEAEFNKVVDVTDRKFIYMSALEAMTAVKPADQPRLKTAMTDAAKLMEDMQADPAGLKAVFGKKAGRAKTNYGKGSTKLKYVRDHLNTKVTTDYNLDAPQIGLGGWADFGKSKLHLKLDIAKVIKPDEAKITLIHEASHLADSSIDDFGYYKTFPHFESVSEYKKVRSAAHYEELPRRKLGTSRFAAGEKFKPGVKSGGGTLTRADRIQQAADVYLRKAWDAAVEVHVFIRDKCKKKIRKYSAWKSNLILKISKLMDLTLHHQPWLKRAVSSLDLALTESIARGVAIIQVFAGKIPFPSPVGSLSDKQLRNKIVKAAVDKYGNLLKDEKRDKTLLDWLAAKYKKIPS